MKTLLVIFTFSLSLTALANGPDQSTIELCFKKALSVVDKDKPATVNHGDFKLSNTGTRGEMKGEVTTEGKVTKAKATFMQNRKREWVCVNGKKI